MRVHKIFPQECLEFEYPSLLNWEEMDTFLSTQVRYKGPTGLSHTHNALHKELFLTRLTSWFRMCLEDARTHYSFQCEELRITTCWANCAWGEVGLQHHAHDHPLSTVSGVFYASQSSARTQFINPYYSHKIGRFDPHRTKDNNYWSAPSSPGTLLLFPSGLVHQTEQNWDAHNRWTISFNALPHGECNWHSQGIETTSATILIPD